MISVRTSFDPLEAFVIKHRIRQRLKIVKDRTNHCSSNGHTILAMIAPNSTIHPLFTSTILPQQNEARLLPSPQDLKCGISFRNRQLLGKLLRQPTIEIYCFFDKDGQYDSRTPFFSEVFRCKLSANTSFSFSFTIWPLNIFK